MGLSTSSVTFFRSMGGTLGAAVSLGVLFGTVRSNIAQRATDAHLPREIIAGIKSVSLDNTGNFASLPANIKHVVLSGFADSMDTVFLVVAIACIPAFIGSLFIKEIPLRTQGGLESTRSTSDEGDLAMTETAVL